MRFEPLPQPHPDPRDLTTTIRSLRDLDAAAGNEPAWLVLDGYHLDGDYQHAMRAAGRRLLVIDDINHLPHYHADILCNQNITATDLRYRCDPDTRLLLGTRYAMLRPEFTEHGAAHPTAAEQAKRILVTLGGADADNVTTTVLRALASLDRADLHVRVVAGPANPHIGEIHAAAKTARGPVDVLIAVEDMAGLMRWADIAVSAGGTTCWELLYLGVPSLLIVVADNQREGVAKIAAVGAAISLGCVADLTTEAVAASCREMIESPERRREISAAARAVVDGLGANRVVDAMLEVAAPEPQSRDTKPATAGDCGQP